MWLLWVIPSLYVSVFLHEVGHAVFGRLNGFRVTSFGLGIARPLAIWNWFGSRVFLCRTRSSAGITFVKHPLLYATPAQWAWVLSGGQIVNAFLGLGAAALYRFAPGGQDLWWALACTNAFLTLSGIFPIRVPIGKAVLNSDCAALIDKLRGRETNVSIPAILQTLTAFSSLAESVGDMEMRYAYGGQAASLWLALGDIPEANRIWEATTALPEPDDKVVHAQRLLTDAAIALSLDDLDRAEHACREAEDAFGKMDHAMGQLLSDRMRACLTIRRGDVPTALDLLERISVSPLVRRQPELQMGLLVGRIEALAALQDRERAEELLAQYEATRHVYPYLGNDLSIYRVMARFYGAMEIPAQEIVMYRRCLSVVKAIYSEFTDTVARDRFVACQKGLLAEAEASFESYGGSEETDGPGDLFSSVDREAEEQNLLHAWRQRRLVKLGIGVTVATLVLALSGPWTGPWIGSFTGWHKAWQLSLEFLLKLTVTIPVLNCIAFFASGYAPGGKRLRGHFFLGFSLVPILSWLAVWVFFLIPLLNRR